MEKQRTYVLVLYPRLSLAPEELFVENEAFNEDLTVLPAMEYGSTVEKKLRKWNVVFACLSYLGVSYVLTGQLLETSLVIPFLTFNIIASLAAQSPGYLIGGTLQIKLFLVVSVRVFAVVSDLVRWKDNKCVAVATNFDTLEPTVQVMRWCKEKSAKAYVPTLINNYNKYMGGVDMHEWLLEKHVIAIKEVDRSEVKSKITFRADGIIKVWRRIKPNKAPGPKDISARVFKEVAENVAPFLKLIFEKVISKGNS
ncbi:hypothetical protein J437_LFUL000503 [Ladona fulva]|uniref:Uncharacterized protein n=1 Tax=Ladona fulva TaxID=123851 RepID=A0A8K0JTP6_LADFU|nr:hypothetical protein J437_LFUL000503 [Ladona fulva]